MKVLKERQKMTKCEPQKERDLAHREGQIAALWARINYILDEMMKEKAKKRKRAKI